MVNTNAATSPTIGTSRSSSVFAVIRSDQAIRAIATTPATSDVGPLMNPSGMCIASTPSPLPIVPICEPVAV
jgi:hypothetical protein